MKAKLILLTASFLCAVVAMASGFVVFWIGSGIYAGLLLFLATNERREDKFSRDAEAFWARYQPEWMVERLQNEHSQEYIEWLQEGRQRGYLK